MRYCCYGCLVMIQLVCCQLHGQSYFSTNNNPEPEILWELGFSAGAINCLTDIGGKSGTGKKFIKDINWNKTQFCGGLFASATWQSGIALRLEATFGQVTGSDDVLKNTTGIAKARYLRNLHFRTAVLEGAVISEWQLLTLLDKSRDPPLLSPYLAAGIGIFSYNPQAFVNNVWVDLRPLHTEGEGFAEYPDRKVYKSTSWCVPAGAGIRYDASGLINLRLEILYRFTGTDYLDDVSTRYADPSLFRKYLSATTATLATQLADRSKELAGNSINNINDIRGNPNNKDAYFSLSLKISIALGRDGRK